MNNRGKDICKELKAVRKRIAEENGIDLEIPECTYHGPCKGTCPRCESEVRFLENALAQKIRMGKVATVAGLALTLGVSGSAAAQSTTTDPEPVPPSHERLVGDCEVSGVVVDERTHKPVPFAEVMLYKDTARAMVVQTDLDGRYRFTVHNGRYTLVVRSLGYNEYRRDVKVQRSEEQCVMKLVYNSKQFDTYDRPKVDTVGMERPSKGQEGATFNAKGTVIDSMTKEVLPFVNVIVLKNGKQVNVANTDFDGNFNFKLEKGEYEFVFSEVGYARKRIPVKVPNDMPLKAIELEGTATMGEVIIESGSTPMIEIGPEVQTKTEIDGVPLRVQY